MSGFLRCDDLPSSCEPCESSLKWAHSKHWVRRDKAEVTHLSSWRLSASICRRLRLASHEAGSSSRWCREEQSLCFRNRNCLIAEKASQVVTERAAPSPHYLKDNLDLINLPPLQYIERSAQQTQWQTESSRFQVSRRSKLINVAKSD